MSDIYVSNVDTTVNSDMRSHSDTHVSCTDIHVKSAAISRCSWGCRGRPLPYGLPGRRAPPRRKTSTSASCCPCPRRCVCPVRQYAPVHTIRPALLRTQSVVGDAAAGKAAFATAVVKPFAASPGARARAPRAHAAHILFIPTHTRKQIGTHRLRFG